MDEKQLFKKHYSRLVTEGIIKSVLFGLAIGFAANFVTAFLAWLFDFNGIWLAIGVAVGASAVSAVLLYFLKYKPSEKDLARRLDRLGLEERMITMLDLRGESSPIANLQRRDAKQTLASTPKNIRFAIPKVLVVLVIISVILGSSMTTVVGLAANDIIPGGGDVFPPEDPYENYIPVTYLVENEDAGWIEGEADQLVLPGESTSEVVAVAEEGWMFVGWDDGHETPERFDQNITEERVYIATFKSIDEDGGDGEAGEGKPGDQDSSQEGDSADDIPAQGGANVESESQGDAGDKGDGSGASSDSDGGQGSTEEEGEGKGDGQGLGAGGKWSDSNQFIDGKTYYKDQLDMYYQMALLIFEETGEIPPEYREFFEAYFDSI